MWLRSRVQPHFPRQGCGWGKPWRFRGDQLDRGSDQKGRRMPVSSVEYSFNPRRHTQLAPSQPQFPTLHTKPITLQLSPSDLEIPCGPQPSPAPSLGTAPVLGIRTLNECVPELDRDEGARFTLSLWSICSFINTSVDGRSPCRLQSA